MPRRSGDGLGGRSKSRPLAQRGERKGRRLPRAGDLLSSGVAVVSLALVAGFISIPLVALLIWTADNNYWQAMASPAAREALSLSIRTTAASMAIILCVGTPAAYVLSRASFPGKRLVDTLIDIPAVLPPAAAGIALLLAFGTAGLLGEQLQVLGVTLSFTTAAVVMAQIFVSIHFYIRQASVGFSSVDRGVEEAAMVDGAGRFSVFVRITVPLAFPALLAGAVTAWARALGEFGGTIIFAGNFQGVTQTIPLAIFAELERDFDAAVALSVLALSFSFVVILSVRYLTRKATEYGGGV